MWLRRWRVLSGCNWLYRCVVLGGGAVKCAVRSAHRLVREWVSGFMSWGKVYVILILSVLSIGLLRAHCHFIVARVGGGDRTASALLHLLSTEIVALSNYVRNCAVVSDH
jgi:hypothetical protein